jgi:hypothetical protein
MGLEPAAHPWFDRSPQHPVENRMAHFDQQKDKPTVDYRAADVEIVAHKRI